MSSPAHTTEDLDTDDPSNKNDSSSKKPAPTVIDDGSPVQIASPAGSQAIGATIEASPLHVPTGEQSLPVGLSANEPNQPNKWRSRLTRIGGWVRHGLLLLSVVAAVVIFLQQVHPHYAIKHWLFWSYAKIWGYCTLFVLAVVGSGHLVTKSIGCQTLPFVERTVLSLGVGVFAFYLVMFGGGLFGAYGPVWAIGMPVLLFGVTAVPLVRHVRRAKRVFRAAQTRTKWRPSVWFWAQLLFGAGGIGLIYFAILSPRNIAYDAHFYHLAIAQQYATDGAIRPFLDGWLPGTIPHLASVLYTWSFLLPGLNMFERITCAAHMEFIIFLFTLPGVPVLVRKLVPNASAGLSWIVFFLFPGLLVYDSALSCAADHIAAFWSIPIFLLMLRSLGSLNVWKTQGAYAARNFGLLAAFFACAVLTKYQAMYQIAFPLLAIVVMMVWSFVRALVRRNQLRTVARTIAVGSSVAIVVGLALTTPHWLKNFIWYGDPLFPYLYRYFHAPQWTTDVSVTMELWAEQTKGWKPQGALRDQLLETAQAMVYFSFEPHDWPRFHGKVPIFGSLFTLSALALLFLKKTRRIWALFIATEIGIAIWYWTLHQDRYLQSLVPWMVCVVAATLTLLWRSHWTARIPTSVLVGVQIVWGGDAYFIPAHAMTGSSAAPVTAELLSLGFKGKYAERYALGDRLFEIGRDAALPRNAKVLLHEWQTRLGVWRPVVSDFPGHMYAFRYEEIETPTELDKRIRGLGVTHILTRPQASSFYDSLGADLQFFAYVDRDTTLVKKYNEWALHVLRPTLTTRTSNNLVAYLGCGPRYERGLYGLSKLSVRDRLMATKPPRVSAEKPVPTNPQEWSSFIAQVDYLVSDPKCKPAVGPDLTRDFIQIATRDSEVLWLRRK